VQSWIKFWPIGSLYNSRELRSAKRQLQTWEVKWFPPVEHGVKGRHLVHAHGWHFEELGNVVHDANACPALVLPLSEVEEGDDGCFLVLGRVARDDFLCPFHVRGIELEGNLNQVFRMCLLHANEATDLGVVVGSIPVLQKLVRNLG
jgi:hypothetical protein